MKSNTKISVCMATHNGERFIHAQISSILPQLKDNDEIIISDDGSTDATIDIIKGFNDPRISILYFDNSNLKLDKIQKVTKNFENALKQATGDIIFLSDQDDVWAENKVSVMLNALENYDYAVSDAHITDQSLNIIGRIRNSYKNFNRYKVLLTKTPYQGSCAAFRRNVLDKALPFPKHLQSHDRWIGFIATFGFKYCFVPECLVLYRRHESNSSTGGTVSTNSTYYKVKTRLYYISALIKRLIFNQ